MGSSYSSDARATRGSMAGKQPLCSVSCPLDGPKHASPWLISPARSRFSPWLAACKTGT